MIFITTGWKTIFSCTRFSERINMFLLMACFLAACQSSPKEVDAQDDGTLPTDFIEFYDKYHADSAFQLEHTLFPLPYLGQKKNIQEWTADNWVLHQPIDIEASELFDRSFYRIGHSIIGEEIISPSLNLKIERRWQETQGKWLLIYYQPLD